MNKRESDRLLKESHAVSPQSFDGGAISRRDKPVLNHNPHPDLSHYEGKQQSLMTSTKEEEVKEEKNVIYSSSVTIRETSENGKRMLRTVQDVS